VQQQELGQTMTWSATQKLTFGDFKKTIPGNTVEAACTVWSINISNQPKQVQDTFYMDVEALFSKSQSSKSSKKESLTETVLAHEQGHFDIAELYARILRKDLQAAHFKDAQEFFKKVQSLYNKDFSEGNKYQLEYDKETNHSMNAEGQQRWEKKIAEQLQEYSTYTNTHLKLVVGK
jgi:hypothetical protein